MSEVILEQPGEGVTAGIRTDLLASNEPPALWVTWIEWNSDFRRELKVNDLIVGVNGKPISVTPGQVAKLIGQAGESQLWSELGSKPGDELRLSVLRDGESMTVRGRLGREMFYYDREGKAAWGPGGPPRLARGKNESSWTSWQEKLQFEMSFLQTRGWSQKTSTRQRLAGLLEQKEEVDYTVQTWPGPLAETLLKDWSATVELMRGEPAKPPVDLEYRSLGEKRVAAVKAEAAKGWAGLLKETEKDQIPASPAASPMDRGAAVGKVVELPVLTPRRMLSELGKSFAAFGSPADGWWFLMLDRPELHRFWEVLHGYRGQVNPRVTERYRFLGRVRNEAQMLTVDDRPAMGLTLEVLGGLAGDDEMFVDLRKEKPRFAGEDALSALSAPPRDDGSPASVMEAMVTAIKHGDEEGYRALFAPWRVVAGPGGREVLDLSYLSFPGALMAEWERSRSLMMGEVYDARVRKVERTRRLFTRSAESGLPDVDQTVVWLDHYGLFDGEHRTFQNVNVNRRWVLQRLDGGPWRIVTVQNL